VFEEEQLQDPRGHDGDALSSRPARHVAAVGAQQEVVAALPHASEVVEAEHLEDVLLHAVRRFLATATPTVINKVSL